MQCRRPRFNPWVGKIPWRRKWQPAPVFLPGKFHGQRGLAGYSSWNQRVRYTEPLTLDVNGSSVWWRIVSVSWNIHSYHCHLAGLAWPAGPSTLFTPWMLFVPVLVWWLPGTVHVFKQHAVWERITLLVYNSIARDWLRWFQKIWSKVWLSQSIHFLRRRVRLTPARFLFVCSLFPHPFTPTIYIFINLGILFPYLSHWFNMNPWFRGALGAAWLGVFGCWSIVTPSVCLNSQLHESELYTLPHLFSFYISNIGLLFTLFIHLSIYPPKKNLLSYLL